MPGPAMSGLRPLVLAAAALLLVAFGLVAEGAVAHHFRALLTAGFVVLAVVAGATVGLPATGRTTRAALLSLLLAVAWAILPIPELLRTLVAPGQARWITSLAPAGPGSLSDWLNALTLYDLEAALGAAPAWTYNSLLGSPDLGVHRGASGLYLLWPELLSWAGLAAAYVVGMSLGRDGRAIQLVAVCLLVIGVGEALFGLVMRHGPSTGIGVKEAYLGSATGTLINRGHFASLMVICLAMATGLMSALFPLIPRSKGRSRHRRGTSGRPAPTMWEASGDKLPRLVLLAFMSSLLVVGLVASQSRSPVLAVLAAGVLVGGWTWHRRDEKFHVGIFGGVLAAGLAMAVVTFGLRGAFGRFVGVLQGDDVSVSSRVAVWKASLQAFADAPLFGHGPGNWRLGWTLHEPSAHLYEFRYAHSELFQLLVEVGLIGTFALGWLLLAWGRGVLRRLDVASQDARTALGVGATLATTAVALQSLVDFPLHTHGIGVLTFLLAGMALGALTDPQESWQPVRWLLLPPAFAALWLAAVVGRGDSEDRLSRDDELSERPALYYTIQGQKFTRGQVEQLTLEATELTRTAPLAPWAWLTLGLTRTLDLGRSGGGQVEDRVLEVDRAVTRAILLRPRDPRVLEIGAAALLRASRAVVQRDALKARGEVLLSGAVALDPWRAEAIFQLADPLDVAAIGRIAQSGVKEGVGAARVYYQYGRALERRKEGALAMEAYREASNRDRNFGPPAFSAGALAQSEGDLVLADRWFERFLEAQERPPGMEGWARLYRKDYAGAEVQFRRVLAENPDNRWSLEGVAAICRARGDTMGEVGALQRVLQGNPGDKRVRARLDELEAGP